MEAFLVEAPELAFLRHFHVAIRRETDRADRRIQFFRKLVFKSWLLFTPKFHLPLRIGNGFIQVPDLHLLSFADHSHRLFMGDGAS